MDTQRIDKALGRPLREKTVAVVGNGGAAAQTRLLARYGIGAFRLLDRDTVGAENLCRQDFTVEQLGRPKSAALAENLRRINPDVRVTAYHEDFTALTDAELDARFAGVDVLVMATDNHGAQARGNAWALRTETPAVFSGVYEGGGGEVFFWHKGLRSCYRCMLSVRYAAQENGRGVDPLSDGGDVFPLMLIDGIAGQIVLGLLTSGAPSRYGRLIAALGSRNFIQFKIDPDWNWQGRDLFHEVLGTPQDNDALFSWCAIARRVPDGGGYCPDCLRYRQKGIETIPSTFCGF